jgi:ATP-dependent Clp protease ATP-binding subunit ClpC
MLTRFSTPARNAVVLAEEEARALRHHEVATEHLLLGLLRVNVCLAARVLASLRVTWDEVHAQVLERRGDGDGEPDEQLRFAADAKKALELALRESLSVGQTSIRSEHLLLGLARQQEGLAARILLDLGADASRIRARVVEALGYP